MKNISLGYIYVISVPIAATLGSVQGINVFGVRYTGIIWILYFIIGLLLFLYRMALLKYTHLICPFKNWFYWFGIVWLSLLWGESINLRNIQDALQITSPLVSGYLAFLFINDKHKLISLYKSFYIGLILLICLIFISTTRSIESFGVSPMYRASALTATLIGCVFFSKIKSQFLLSILGWGFCISFTYFTGSRTATFVLLSLLVFFPLYQRIYLKPIAIFICILVGFGIFSTQKFQEHFFGKDTGSISKLLRGDFLSMGRFEAWPIIWEKSKKNIYFGSGIGSTNDLVPKIYPGDEHVVTHVHNDYLRILYEQGLVGLTIYAIVVLLQLHDIRKKFSIGDYLIKQIFVASYLGIICLLLTSLTDNTIIYNLWYMSPLFVLLGAGYGSYHKYMSQYKILM